MQHMDDSPEGQIVYARDGSDTGCPCPIGENGEMKEKPEEGKEE